MSSFRYNPLNKTTNEIRIVTVRPGAFDDPIKIEISHSPLKPPPPQNNTISHHFHELNRSLSDNKPWKAYETMEGRILFVNSDTQQTSWDHPNPAVDRNIYDRETAQIPTAQPSYESLSYTWGDPTPTKSVEVVAISGQDNKIQMQGQGSLEIGHNLDEALRYLRYPTEPRTMWIDALCINQEDIQERNEQVRRMGQIFGLATRVVAWIGPEAEESKLALDQLNYVAEQVVWTQWGSGQHRPGYQDPSWLDTEIPLPHDDTIIPAIMRLLSRSWFRRLWVVQEIHLSSLLSIIQCGYDTILWSRLQAAALTLCSTHDDGMSGKLKSRLWDASRICFYGKFIKFHDFLWTYHGFKCQDPHDKVYGLINLAPLGISNRIIPDYSQPVFDLYKQTFLAYFDHFKRLDLLPCCGPTEKTASIPNPDWPSWVPDWRGRSLETIPPGDAFCASSHSRAYINNKSPNELEIAGICLATIDSVHLLEVKNLAELAQYINSLGLERLMSSRYMNGDSLLDTYLHCFATSRFKNRFPLNGLPEIDEVREYLVSLATGADYDMTQRLSIWETRIMVGLQDSYCFLASDGYIGVSRTRGTIEKGDKIFIPLGCQTPVILRPSDTGHKIISDCFVHGVMSGEAFLGALPTNWVAKETTGVDGIYRTCFLDLESESQRLTLADPRLEDIPLPLEWEFVDWGVEVHHPVYCPMYEHRETVELIGHDPRMSIESLRSRGVAVEFVTLI